MSGPLSGLKVVDCSRGSAGTRATGLLADYGADVVWVEPPGGDPFREPCAIEYSVYNRGKRSIELNLKTADGLEHLLELLARADLFVESWRPGVAARLGIGYEALHERYPGLVYTSISGFGQSGPHSSLAGYEALVQAFVGSMGEQPGYRDGPIYEGLPFATFGAAYLAVIGGLAALYRRESDGIGRRVETSLLDGALAYLSMMWGDTDKTDKNETARAQAGGVRLIARTYLCGDGEYMGVHTAAVGGFSRLMNVLGLEDRIPPSETGVDVGVPLTPEQAEIVENEIPQIFESRDRDHWLKILRENDVCAIPELHPGQVLDEPQPRHNQMIATVDDPVLGPVEQVAPPAKFPELPADELRPAPRVGEHTQEILRELVDTPRPDQRDTNTDAEAESRPLLDGLRVLDLGAYYAGPYSSRLMADLGADVIKLEPTYGDQLRGLDRPFRSAQAGKRGIAANLKERELDAARRKLLEWADLVHHNMRPGAAERLGVSLEDQRQINPQCVYLYAPGWGASGPDMKRQSFAPLLSGYVGASYECGGQFNPPIFPLGNEDPGNGLVGAVAGLMALLHRCRSGTGDYVENPQVNAAMTHVQHIVRRADGTILGAERLDPLQRGVSALDRLYETADGHLCIVAMRPAEIEALSRATGVDILGDERFAAHNEREANDYELGELLENAFSQRSTDSWMASLDAEGVPAMVPMPYNNVPFLRNPANQASGRVVELPHPRDGHVRELAQLMRVSHASIVPHRLAPGLGEHTDEILKSLGYNSDQIANLRKSGAIR